MKRHKVNCDASWSEGRATLAVSGSIGEHVRHVEAATNVIAEIKAVLFAMEIAKAEQPNPRPLRFQTDCRCIVEAKALRGEQGELLNRVRRYLACYRQWRLVAVSRRHTHAADRLAAKWRGFA